MTFLPRLAALFAIAVLAGAAPAKAGPHIVIEAESGAVLSSEDAMRSWHPASLTKLMTAYVAFRAIREGRLAMTSPVKVSQAALNEPPSKMGFKVGTVMTVENALKMLLVKSANDIAVALGEAVSDSRVAFVREMNREAARLGMTGTSFVNPNGLPVKDSQGAQVTTARDLAILARAIWLEFPEHRALFAIPAIRSGQTVMRNHNMLLERYPGTNGMKTGFICASGFNVVATATRGERTLIAVVLGATSANERAETAARLLNASFGWGSFFNRGRLQDMTGPVVTPAVDMRPIVCARNSNRGEEDTGAEAFIDAEQPISALVPRFKLGDPVRVVTGGADSARPRPAPTMPLPRPRPVIAGGLPAAASTGLGSGLRLGTP